MTSHANNNLQRQLKLNGFFEDSIRDSSKIGTAAKSLLFIQAVCAQEEVLRCVERLIASRDGLLCLQICTRCDLSTRFLNGPAAQLLEYFSSPDVASINGGQVLEQILQALVQHRFFWSAFVTALQQDKLSPPAVRSLAWLFSQVLQVLPADVRGPFLEHARDPAFAEKIVSAQDAETRALGHKIKHIASLSVDDDDGDSDADGPGGRHDNDFRRIQDIAVFPTGDELLSTQPPFLRIAHEIFKSGDVLLVQELLLDNQFRLLREDMIKELREEIQAVLGSSKKRHRGLFIPDVRATRIQCFDPPEFDEDRKKWHPWCLCFQSQSPLPDLIRLSPQSREKFLSGKKGGDGGKILRDRSLVAILSPTQLIGFGFVHRNVKIMAMDKAEIAIQIDDASISSVLRESSAGNRMDILQVDTAVFAYEPFLRQLQAMKKMPLAEELLIWTDGSIVPTAADAPLQLINRLVVYPSNDLQDVIDLPKSVYLDESQNQSLITGLRQRVSLIQGPPGTGKSFIGAILVKSLLARTRGRILVVCYTNHALDQFLEDLMDIGISSEDMVRLGAKSSSKTDSVLLKNQKNTYKMSKTTWNLLTVSQTQCGYNSLRITNATNGVLAPITNNALMNHLEFAYELSPFYEAFKLSESDDGTQMMNSKGKRIKPYYLISRWRQGLDNPGVFQDSLTSSAEVRAVWKLPMEKRKHLIAEWSSEIHAELVSEVESAGRVYNTNVDMSEKLFRQKQEEVLRSKGIIACTTTGAAKYSALLEKVSPEILLVEEAGEVLESHIITALAPTTKHLIMIGDHKQLRPKIANHELTVEKGLGYDLNKSLFERMVINGFPHTMLTKQHRMRPEISAIVRHLTYPDLEDAPSTMTRPEIRGLRANVVFVDHNKPETFLDNKSGDRAGESRQNQFEADLVLKYVKYLAQQGYGSDDIIVLTPYLGQLILLRDTLTKENDPVLNDMDRHDLLKAGLLDADTQSSNKRSVHLSSIDNYQGEEKKIVIASLTRSNPNNEIGFMSEASRLNVMLSRARDGMIVIGNLTMFSQARKGSEHWLKLVNFVKSKDYIFHGLPVRCQTHPSREATLYEPEDFDRVTPDGGCSEPCGEVLVCGVHKCPSRCHILSDHSSVRCTEILSFNCSKGHLQGWKCYQTAPLTCDRCERDDRRRKRKAKTNLERQQQQEAEIREHENKMDELDVKIEQEIQKNKDAGLREQRTKAISLKKEDLNAARSIAALCGNAQASSIIEMVTTKTEPGDHNPEVENIPSNAVELVHADPSPAKLEWERQKLVYNAHNDAIDGIMDLVGLEAVKEQVLSIASKVNTTMRQGGDLSRERFHISFLGNAGTGKTTVARLYAKFLSSLGVLPAHEFVETTGSRLADGGVPAAKKLLDKVLNAGGGAIFIDEAYQLTSGSSTGGRNVLDFYLAEIENVIGKVVFIAAGYKNQMETFFAHNPGLSSRFPFTLTFDDYEDKELLIMLSKLFDRQFASKAKIDQGPLGLYARILVRRLGRNRGHERFGNIRDLENLFAQIRSRQANRLDRERRDGLLSDDFYFKKEDLLGPNPAVSIKQSKAWESLKSLIGLGEVKDRVSVLLDILNTNYLRELREERPIQVSLNHVFLGSPGTGKTSVAKLYGQILVDLGMLSNGEVVVKTPSDFIGAALGASEQNTKAILQASKGKVLIIDEAYMLNPCSGSSGSANDQFRTAVIDTIVSEVHSVPGDDRCVLLLGYEDQMRSMFQAANPGFSRRFPLEDAFKFHDFNDSELQRIMDLKLEEQNIRASPAALDLALEILRRARDMPNFGNAGAVENLISKAKLNHQKTMSRDGNSSTDFVLEPRDFDPDYDRAEKSGHNLHELFKDTVGSIDILRQMESIQKTARGVMARGLDVRDHVPTTFVFKGPPGTGKTTTARKIGQVYYDMKFLSHVEVIECSASDLIGEYVGHTGPKTRKQLEKALGRVLFIDEAYRLGEGHFAREAVDELVDLLTKPAFKGKLVVILAGYEDQMNALMKVNPGLASRFTETVNFQSLQAKDCMKLLANQLKRNHIECGILGVKTAPEYNAIMNLFDRLRSLSSWGSGRDVQNIAKKLMRSIFEVDPTTAKSTCSELSAQQTISCLQKEFDERLKSETTLSALRLLDDPPFFNPPVTPAPQTPPIRTNIERTKNQAAETSEELKADGRDPGVTDEQWAQLMTDMAREQQALANAEAAVRGVEQDAVNAAEESRIAEDDLEKARSACHAEEPGDGKSNEEKEQRRILELMRQARAAAQAKQDAANRKMKEEKKRLQEERRKQALTQEKLRQLGVCCAGFRWIKQAGGYRCAGGSHFVDDTQLAL